MGWYQKVHEWTFLPWVASVELQLSRVFAGIVYSYAIKITQINLVKQLLLAFTVDRWASHTNIVSDFEQNFLKQQVPNSNFHSKLPCFTFCVVH